MSGLPMPRPALTRILALVMSMPPVSMVKISRIRLRIRFASKSIAVHSTVASLATAALRGKAPLTRLIILGWCAHQTDPCLAACRRTWNEPRSGGCLRQAIRCSCSPGCRQAHGDGRSCFHAEVGVAHQHQGGVELRAHLSDGRGVQFGAGNP